MGKFAINTLQKIAAWLIASVLVFLNLKMLVNEIGEIFTDGVLWQQVLISIGVLLCSSLLLYIIISPKRKKHASTMIHAETSTLKTLDIPSFNKIAIALDFSEHDEKLLAYALGQGKKDTQYILMHIVESASAKLFGDESDDYESRKDKERMDGYVLEMKSRGYMADGFLGYKNRAKEIVRIAREVKADMLVMGAHGHTGIKDFIYGETVNTVRHELKIPVLIVNL